MAGIRWRSSRQSTKSFSVGLLLVAAAFVNAGCVVAAVPLVMAASAAVVGFTVYKTVQTTTGGTVRIAFGDQNGKKADAPPLPAVSRIAVWPGSQKETKFADALTATKKFTVSSPSTSMKALTAKGMGADLKQLTEQERLDAFAVVCTGTNAQLVMASIDQGTTMSSNFWSFQRGNVTVKSDLLGYDCAHKTIAWRDRMAIIAELGDKSVGEEEIAKIAGDAWAERVASAPTS